MNLKSEFRLIFIFNVVYLQMIKEELYRKQIITLTQEVMMENRCENRNNNIQVNKKRLN